eukprot:Rhum_TRINITY_DN14737_c13_g1::Rhum_TRINITY_DN14737_c13_g1_i1::g.113683::m.113683
MSAPDPLLCSTDGLGAPHASVVSAAPAAAATPAAAAATAAAALTPRPDAGPSAGEEVVSLLGALSAARSDAQRAQAETHRLQTVFARALAERDAAWAERVGAERAQLAAA